MPRDIFTDVSHPNVCVGSRQWYTVPLSITAHAVMVGVVVVIPLMAADVLPSPQSRLSYVAVAPASPPPPPPPAPQRPSPSPTPVPQSPTEAIPLLAPQSISPEPPLDLALGDSIERLALPGIIDGVLDGVPEAPPPPPPPPTPQRVGGDIAEPERLTYVAPDYPSIARQAHVEGIVILEAVIDANGHVTRVGVLRSSPLLDEAAVSAVKQWVYTPTLLNGVAIPVVLTVTVQFRLE